MDIVFFIAMSDRIGIFPVLAPSWKADAGNFTSQSGSEIVPVTLSEWLSSGRKPRLGVLLFLGVSLAASPAYAAVLAVSSPDVEEGKGTVDISTSMQRDHTPDKDVNKYVMEAGYGVTSYWNTGIELTGKEDFDTPTSYAATAWKNTLQLWKQDEEVPLSIGVRLQYEKTHMEGGSDKAIARLLLRHKTEHFDTRFNIGGEKKLDGDSESGISGDIRAEFRYLVDSHFKPAIDYLGNTGGGVHDLPDFDQQDHRIGPSIYGEVVKGVEYGVGYLTGVSSHAADHTVKFSLGYNF
jgi:hypothetical protein